MNYKTQYPYSFTFHENIHLPLKDGTNLAANLWLPSPKLPAETFGAILEYLPYGKNTGTAIRDHLTHPYLSGHGYACLRVDMRGNGESEGLMFDEYLPQEQEDCIEVIEWIIKQPWSNQKVGMMGISWGGFNGLQVAYLRPKALKAVITICSTDDRYSDDIHYKGGALLCENMGWAATMLCYSSMIPDPKLESNWEEMWLHRLKNLPILIKNWLSHQQRDSFWKHGSICEDYSRIEAAIYTIGGWNDSYRNTPFRMFRNLKSPRKALLGPWCHKYPHFAKPAPAIGFLQEAVRFWNVWLRDKQNDVMQEERNIIAFIQSSRKPQSFYESVDGFWVRESSLESKNFGKEKWFLSFGNRLERLQREDNVSVKVNSDLSTGKHAGEYCIIWMGAEFPVDQREDDAHSIVFDSLPLEKDLCLLGTPTVSLFVSSNKPFGQVIVRLNEVHEDGQVTRVSYGVLNLAFRKGDFENASPLNPDQVYPITIKLDDVGYAIKKGNKIRVAISNCYFPLVFPTKEMTELTVHLKEKCVLELPVYGGEKIECPFEKPEANEPLGVKYLKEPSNSRKVVENLKENSIITKISDDFGVWKYPNGITIAEKAFEKYFAKKTDPNSIKIDYKWEYSAIREEMDIKVDVVNIMRFSCDFEYFYIETEIDARKNGEIIYKNKENNKIKRVSI